MKPVASPAGEDVQMRVKDGLERRTAIREEEVDALTAETRSADRSRDAHREAEHLSPGRWIEVGEAIRMLHGHDHRVSGIDGANSHERGDGVVAIDEAGLSPARQNLAEDAVRGSQPYSPAFACRKATAPAFARRSSCCPSAAWRTA
jgi:hypothetical protein